MSKLWLIVQREYLSRVQKKSFVLTTLLTPLAFLVFFVFVGFIMSYEGDEARKIAVIDESDMLRKAIKDDATIFFSFPKESLDSLKAKTLREEYSGVLVIPPLSDLQTTEHTVQYYSDNQLSLDAESAIKDALSTRLREYKIATLELDPKVVESLRTKVKIDPMPIADETQELSSMRTAIGAGIGFLMGIMMYLGVFIYGMMIMRSVMEEKTNRIVEVMISTIRPFQLMMGKIIGVGAVGLTQFLVWIILIPLISILVNLIFGFDTSQMQGAGAAAQQIDPDDMQSMIAMAMQELGQIEWWIIVPLFLVFFLLGYLLYASLFAAVGSAVGDDIADSQSLTMPISIPVLIAFYIMMVSVRSPHSTLAVWASIFPLFSPIVMPARLAFDVPWWQIALSVVLLAATVIFFVWISARIYRIGILMYGKKVTIKELGKWLFYKD
ncbi:MAG: ABC transporter permease [Saprospiraceae bacterium]|jgi:ABC-2 type transport system permease protein|nr:ABC transporter permease [Saprospiraceae bacterium]